jgi:hypothetical protein
MALTYTLEEIRDNLDIYADFEEVGDVSRAKAYITWGNRWLQRVAESGGNGGSNVSMSKSLVLDLLKRARAYVAANDTAANASGVRFLGLEGFTR